MIYAATNTSNGSIEVNKPKDDFLEWLESEVEMYTRDPFVRNEDKRRALVRVLAQYEHHLAALTH